MHNHLENGTTGGSDTGEQGNLQNDHSPMVAYYVAVPGKDGVVHVYRYNQGGENGNTDMGTIDDFVKNFNPDNQ